MCPTERRSADSCHAASVRRSRWAHFRAGIRGGGSFIEANSGGRRNRSAGRGRRQRITVTRLPGTWANTTRRTVIILLLLAGPRPRGYVPGVEQVLDILRRELEITMKLCGTPTIGDISRAHIRGAQISHCLRPISVIGLRWIAPSPAPTACTP